MEGAGSGRSTKVDKWWYTRPGLGKGLEASPCVSSVSASKLYAMQKKARLQHAALNRVYCSGTFHVLQSTEQCGHQRETLCTYVRVGGAVWSILCYTLGQGRVEPEFVVSLNDVFWHQQADVTESEFAASLQAGSARQLLFIRYQKRALAWFKGSRCTTGRIGYGNLLRAAAIFATQSVLIAPKFRWCNAVARWNKQQITRV